MGNPQKSKNFNFRLLAKQLLILAAMGTPAWYVFNHLHITLTPSLSKRAYWYVEDPRHKRQIKTGEYIVFDHMVKKPTNRRDSTFIEHVVFSLFSSEAAMKRLTFIKRVGCSAGETLKVENDYYYCNEQYLGHAKRVNLSGEIVHPFVFDGKIPAGKIFAIGDHPDSFDSRYYGFVQREQVKEVAWAAYCP